MSISTVETYLAQRKAGKKPAPLKLKLTNSLLVKLPVPSDKNYTISSETLPALKLESRTNGKQLALVTRRIAGGNPTTVVLGDPKEFKNVAALETKAGVVIQKLREGINPNAEKAEYIAAENATRAKNATNAVTLEKIWKEYCDDGGLNLNTEKNIRALLPNHLEQWRNMSIHQFYTWDELVKVRNHVHKSKGLIGAANHVISAASGALAYYRTANRKIRAGLPTWPIESRGDNKAFYKPIKLKKRTSYLSPEELVHWWEATEALPLLMSNSKHGGEVWRDYAQCLLLTGMRKEEAAQLKWKDVSFLNKTLFAADTKNTDDLIVPMSDYLEAMLIQRKADANPKPNDLVFAGVVPQRLTDAIAAYTLGTFDEVIHKSPHDLRRSFVTYGEEVVPHVIVQSLANHRKAESDMTDRYNQGFKPHNLRRHVQAIADHILKIKDTGNTDHLGESS